MTPVFLITDFGLDDIYVGQMKAALLARAPTCLPVDLTHGIAPQDVRGGARAIAESLPHLPGPAVILAVVDPGVGTSRRPLAVQAGELSAVAPDNGLLTPLLRLEGASVHVIDPSAVAATRLSSTFHGRDLFAPAAAMLASGAPIGTLGQPIDDPLQLAAPTGPSRSDDGWIGQVVGVDHFGNLITDLTADHLGDGTASVHLPSGTSLPLVRTYAEVPQGEVAALIGSGGYLEVACNGGSAARATGLGVGALIRLRL